MAAAAVFRSGLLGPPPSFASLVCPTLRSFSSVLQAKHRLVGLDISATHLSVSMSNREKTRAYPWGIITRAKNPDVDASILMDGVKEAERLEGGALLNIGGVVIGWGRGEGDKELGDYLQRVMEWTNEGDEGGDGRQIFQGLKGVMFYDQKAIVDRCKDQLLDFRNAASIIPENVERRRKVRYKLAMNPRELSQDEKLMSNAESRISASDILQAALDDLSFLRYKQKV